MFFALLGNNEGNHSNSNSRNLLSCAIAILAIYIEVSNAALKYILL